MEAERLRSRLGVAVKYRTVFDITQQPFDSSILYIALGFAFIGVFMVARSWQVGELMNWPRPVVYVVGSIALFFSIALSLMHMSKSADYKRYQSVMKKGEYTLVEGLVENFVPMPHGGHAQESFMVRGMRYEYSDYSKTGTFSNTSSHGGPIREGLYVRIRSAADRESNNRILRLEIRE